MEWTVTFAFKRPLHLEGLAPQLWLVFRNKLYYIQSKDIPAEPARIHWVKLFSLWASITGCQAFFVAQGWGGGGVFPGDKKRIKTIRKVTRHDALRVRAGTQWGMVGSVFLCSGCHKRF